MIATFAVLMTRSSIQYPNLPSALQPIPHSNELPALVFKALEISDSI